VYIEILYVDIKLVNVAYLNDDLSL